MKLYCLNDAILRIEVVAVDERFQHKGIGREVRSWYTSNLSCSVCTVLLTPPVHSAQGEGDSIRFHAGTVAALLENRAQRFKLQSRWMVQKSLVKFPLRSQKMTVWNAGSRSVALWCVLSLYGFGLMNDQQLFQSENPVVLQNIWNIILVFKTIQASGGAL